MARVRLRKLLHLRVGLAIERERGMSIAMLAMAASPAKIDEAAMEWVRTLTTGMADVATICIPTS